MSTHPETTMAKLKSAIIPIVCWLAVAIPVYGGLYACSESLKHEPLDYATCERALAALQYANGHHGETCLELERGWCVGDAYDQCIWH
jgi:hypothetical protein